MLPERVTVLGGGNTAFSVAANLALGGVGVTLWEHPSLAGGVAPIRGSRTIHLEGTERTGDATLAGVTTDIAEALGWAETVLVAVPAYAHRVFAETCAPHLRSGQLVVLLPGTLGTLEFARVLRDRPVGGVSLIEVDTSTYVCRKLATRRADIWGTLHGLGAVLFSVLRIVE